MYAGFSVLALIPARGGSKGLPNKNVLDCAGKPLIEWTISAALGASAIDDVLVSTDADDIAAVSRRAGASVPFLRPAELAGDESSMLDVIRQAWEIHGDANGRRFDYIVLLQPTSPLRTSAHIDEAVEFYFKNRRSDDDTLASVHPVGQKHGWLMQTSGDGDYIRFCLDVRSGNPQRQKLKPYYLPNGAIFVVRGGGFADGLYRDNTLPFVMDAADSVDIDTYDDFREAEALLRQRTVQAEAQGKAGS
jgi:CMP-N,N'-diacetyllegionaminic acid synthase